jgi:uncharacterized protein (DUF697 family)
MQAARCGGKAPGWTLWPAVQPRAGIAIALERKQAPKIESKRRTRQEEGQMDREAIADRMIQDHAFYASVGGVIPIPLIDIAAVTVIQLDLVRALARVYHVPFDVATGKAVIASLTGASAARVGASLVKALPGVGTISGGIAQAGLAGASTYAVGQLFRLHFSQQGTLADLDPEEALPLYQVLLERGKGAVRSLRSAPGTSVEATTETLERLVRLRERGGIDAEEFQQLKEELLARGAA